MNMQHIVLGLIVVALLGGGVFFSTQTAVVPKESLSAEELESSPEHMMEDKKMMKDDDAMMKDDNETTTTSDGAMMNDGAIVEDVVMVKVGSYEAYAPGKLTQAASGPVVLFFRASWCPTCVSADKDIKANLKNIPAGTTILDVDYDDSAELKKKYGVTYQHTFVQVDVSGKQIKKWSGSSTLAVLLSQIQK